MGRITLIGLAFLTATLTPLTLGQTEGGQQPDLRELETARIDPASGALLLARVDLEVGSGAALFRLERTWRLFGGRRVNAGQHWATVLDVELVRAGEGRWFVRSPRGAWLPVTREAGLTLTTEADGTRRLAGLEPARAGGPALNARAGGPALNARAYRFDRAGRLAAIEGQGATLHLRRDDDGLVGAVEGPWGLLRLERDEQGQLSEAITPAGRRVRWERDAQGRLTSVSDGRSVVRYAYDRRDLLSAFGDGLAQVEWDARGRVTALAGEGLEPRTATYEGQVVRLDHGGLVSQLTGAPDGRSLSFQTPQGATLEARFDAALRPEALIGGGREQRFAWDEAGRLSSCGTAEGQLRVRRDAEGRPQRLIGPMGLIELAPAAPVATSSRIVRDADGRLVELRHADGSLTRVEELAQGGRRLITRDASGRLLQDELRDASDRVVARTDAQGRRETYTWSPQGRLLEVRRGEARLARLEWDAAGRLRALEDGCGGRTAVTWTDPRTVTLDDPACGPQALRHDAQGRPVELVRGSTAVRLVWNELGQLVARRGPTLQETFRRDTQGRLIEQRGPDAAVVCERDAQGRIVRQGDGAGLELEVRWDARGRRAGLVLPWGELRYERDQAGRLSAIVLEEGRRIEIERLPDGRRSAVRYPNGVVTRWLRDEGGRLSEVRSEREGQLLARRAYAWDEAGRLVGCEDEAGRRTRWTHDAAGRLASETSPAGAVSWTRDALGNVVEERRADVALVSTFSAGSRLVRRGEERFAWGATGELLTRRGPAGETRYAWDDLGRLVGATLPGGETVRYGRTPDGLMAWREVGGQRTRWLHDGEHRVIERDAQGQLSGWVYGEEGLDDLLAARRDGRWWFFHLDRRHDVTAVTDEQGQVVASYAWDADGRPVAGQGQLPWNDLGFAARPRDPLTGLVDLRVRVYDPALGRFLSPDPTRQRGGVNLYAYVDGLPHRLGDPRGTDGVDPEAEERVRRELESVLGRVPEWVEQTIRTSRLSPERQLAVAAQYAEEGGWLDSEEAAILQELALNVIAGKLGIPDYVPNGPVDNDFDAALLSYTLALATGANPIAAGIAVAGGILISEGLEWWRENHHQWAPGDIYPVPGGWASVHLPGAVFSSPEALQRAYEQYLDRPGVDLVAEARRQQEWQLRIRPDGRLETALLPNRSFASAEDLYDAVMAAIRNGTLDPSVCVVPGMLDLDTLQRLSQSLLLEHVLGLQILAEMGVAVQASGSDYSTPLIPDKRYRQLRALIEDVEFLIEFELEAELVRAMGPFLPGTEPPPAFNGYTTPLMPGAQYASFDQAKAAILAYLEEELHARVAPPHQYDGPVITNGPARTGFGQARPGPWWSPEVGGRTTYHTRGDLLRAHRGLAPIGPTSTLPPESDGDSCPVPPR